MSEEIDAKQTEHVVLNVSDMVIRYGVSETEILQYFMHSGLPYHKTGDSYIFYEDEVKEWESMTKCISWDVGQFDTKYYDVEHFKFLARSDYAERMGLESARRDRYLEMKKKAEAAEEDRLEREQKKESKRNLFRLVMLCAAGICFVIAEFYFEQNDFNAIGACFVIVSSILVIITLFTFPQFRVLLAFAVAILAVIGILFAIHESQVRSGFINNSSVMNEWMDDSTDVVTINVLGV